MSLNPVAPTSEASAALAQVLSGLGRLAAVASWQVTDDDLADVVAELDHVTRLARAHGARLLAEAGSRGLPAQAGHARLEHWLRAQVPTASPPDGGGRSPPGRAPVHLRGGRRARPDA